MDIQDTITFQFTAALVPGNIGTILHGDAQSFAEAAGLPFSYGPGAEATGVFTLPNPICEIPQSHHEFFETVTEHAGRPAAFIAGVMHVFGRSDEYDEDGDYVGLQERERPFCGFPTCECEATTTAPVSISLTEVDQRRMCYACSEVYNTGCQHGRLRAIRDLVRKGFVDAAETVNGGPFAAEDIGTILKTDPADEWGS